MDLDVTLTPEHLEQLGKTQPLTGLIELIWNALDADATEITVKFGRNDLDGIEDVVVTDNGHGMLPDQIEERFGALGGSWKRSALVSPGGRPLHGSEGEGRYRAAAIGRKVVWQTVAVDPAQGGSHVRTTIEVSADNLRRVVVGDPEVTSDSPGTKVIVTDLREKTTSTLGGETPPDRLLTTFGLRLQNHNARLIYDKTEVDPVKAQVSVDEIKISAKPNDALLTVIEWNVSTDRALYVCDSHLTPITEFPPGIQAPGFDFTAYLQWTEFDGKTAADLQLANWDEAARKVLEGAKDGLRAYFKRRAKERTREQIDKWKAEKSYPFRGDAKDSAEQAVRDVFDVVAISASGAVSDSDLKSRKLSLRLLREALEQDPGSLHRVLTEVLDLPEEKLKDLSALLDRTPLAWMIALSREVANRLDFLQGLEQIALDRELKKYVKERSQLHKILASETWVFGEEYALSVNDESLTRVLEAHLKVLQPDAEPPSDPVTDTEGHTRIVDLMLSRALAQTRNRREHLVIELKRPSVKIGGEEANQILNYATAVAADSRFNTGDVTWDFIVISSEVTGWPDRERRSDKTPFGLISDADGVRVWVKTWGEILDEAQHRLKFAQQHLDYEPDGNQGIAYLRATHEKYLPEQAKEAPSDDADSAARDEDDDLDAAGELAPA